VNRNKIMKSMLIGAVLPTLFLADIGADTPFGLGLAREAHAVVGAPLTPVSVAGVARRTTRRTVAASAATQSVTSSTAQQQQATAQQQAATAQQQAATAQQQAAVAHQQSAPAPATATATAAAVSAATGVPATGSIVPTLPGGCVQETKGGVAYQRCGSVYYRPAFQGNTLVYVVQ
jgi:hypothetical protein